MKCTKLNANNQKLDESPAVELWLNNYELNDNNVTSTSATSATSVTSTSGKRRRTDLSSSDGTEDEDEIENAANLGNVLGIAAGSRIINCRGTKIREYFFLH